MFKEDDDLVQTRRKELLKPILKRGANNNSAIFGDSKTLESPMVPVASDDSKIIISYTALCDAIYEQNWLF